jgi:phage host-nuclease inhibitor protein Gam
MGKRIRAQVPGSLLEADKLLGRIGALQRELDAINDALTETVAAAKEQASVEAAPHAAALKEAFAGLWMWAENNRADLCAGGRKSVPMVHGVIGWRMGMPTVKVARGREDAIVELLGKLGRGDLIRTRQEIDKEAVLRDPAAIADVPGLSVEQVESFFAKPLEIEVEQVRTVARMVVTRTGDAA